MKTAYEMRKCVICNGLFAVRKINKQYKACSKECRKELRRISFNK
jgi:hypothetical protein